MAQHQKWKPAAYPSLSPYLVVSGAQRLIDFALAAFGATELRRYDRPDGESDKRGMVADPCGNTWVLSTQMPE